MVTEAMVSSMNKETMTWPGHWARVEFLTACSGMRSGVDHGFFFCCLIVCLFVCLMSKAWKTYTSFLHKCDQPELSQMATSSWKRSWKMYSLVGWPYAQLILYYHVRKQKQILWNSFVHSKTVCPLCFPPL